MKDLLVKHKNIISIIIISLVLYIRCDYGVVANYAVVMNCIVVLLAAGYCLMLAVSDFDKTKDSICNIAFLWLLIFQAIQFVYGHFGLLYDTKLYSIRYTLLTIVPAFLVYEILWHNKDEFLNILSRVGGIVIVATFITNVLTDDLWIDAINGEFYRLGKVPGGTVIDTGNLYMLMLIPILYSIFVKKIVKINIVPAIVGVIGILLTGSRSSAMPLAIVIAIMLLGASKSKESLRRNIFIILIAFIVGVVAIMTIPILYEILGSRIVEIFTNLGGDEIDLKTSTGQRLAVWAAFKEHFLEAPIFGHGFLAFKSMPYSQLEMYHENGETLFRNIQTHVNFLELLFSFGFFGFIAYYWYPVKQIVDTIRCKVKENKILALSFLVTIFFMDAGLDMFYKYMTPYYVYLVVYILVGAQDARKEI